MTRELSKLDFDQLVDLALEKDLEISKSDTREDILNLLTFGTRIPQARDLPDDIFGEIGIHLSNKEFTALKPLMANSQTPNEFRCSKQEEILSRRYGLNLRDLIIDIEENRKFIDYVIDRGLSHNESVTEEVREYFYRAYQFDKNSDMVEFFVKIILREALSYASYEEDSEGHVKPRDVTVTLDDIETALEFRQDVLYHSRQEFAERELLKLEDVGLKTN